MRRRAKAIRTLAAMYDLAPDKPEVITAMLKDQYKAMTRLNRQNFYKLLDGIERDHKNGLRYWTGE